MHQVACAFVLYILFYSNVSAINENDGDNLIRKHGGFFFSMPKTLSAGKNETVCLSLHHINTPSRVLVDLKWKGHHFLTERNLGTEHTCFNMHVPDFDLIEPQYVSIKIQVLDGNQVQSAHNQDPILMYPKESCKIFLETDRAMYKPGDLVKIRVLCLNERFLPGDSQISEIKIRNPMDVGVFVWNNMSLDHGLVNLEYPLVEEALIGKWKIEVDKLMKTFEVAKYVVPRFKIDLIHPKSVFYKTNSINITVCAKYSYNKPVAGTAFVKIHDSVNHMKVLNILQEMENGCAYFDISKYELNLSDISKEFSLADPRIFLHITATVTEQGTTKMDIVTGKSEIHVKGYTLKIQSSPIFIPGVPYEGQMKLINAITDITGEVIKLCYNLAIKKSWNYFKNEECRNYTVPEDGIIPFKLWPLKNSVLHIHLDANSINNTNIEDSFLAVRLYSPTSSYIYIERDTNINKTCDTPFQYKILYTTDHFKEGENITFYYMVKINSEINKLKKIKHTVRKHNAISSEDSKSFLGNEHRFVKFGSSVDQFVIKIKMEKIVYKFQILVYYITKDGETVAASRTQEVKPCSYKVDAYWNENQLVPGKSATLTIKSDKQALCAVTATDKATKFISSSQSQNLNWESIIKTMSQHKDGARSSRTSCISNNKKILALHHSANSTSMRNKRHVFTFSEDYDSYDVLNKFGVITISNLKIVTKPCYSGPLFTDANEAEFMTDQYNNDIDETSEVTVRTYFPENWLWEFVPVENSTQIHRDLPHSITTWTTNVYCVSTKDGVSFAPQTEVISIQPFFIQVITPYSIKKDENFYLPINVFNYLNYSFPIRVSIRLTGNLQLTNPHSFLSTSYCLKESSTLTHNYQISGTEVGIAHVTVSVETDNQYALPCGPDTIISKRDAVLKSLIVEAEGFEEVQTKSALICSSDSEPTNLTIWNFNIPEDIVLGTNTTIVTVNGDLLGPTIENLKQLLTIPTGCGEQIMASLAPNIYVLRYLNVTGTLTPLVKQRILRNFKIGYQRILNYMHKDGSFSAFGYYDPAGSMFLTTFVVKILQQIKEFVYVDQKIIDKGIEWIYTNQLENGCFDAVYHVFQDMGGTNTERSTAALTSYVILSLLDAGISVPEEVQTNGKYCIRSQNNPDKYSLIISCYALFRLKWINEGTRFLERILSVSRQEDYMMWWSSKDDNEFHASDIEITSYALLALMHQKTSTNLAHAHSVAKWLSSKIGPTGAFKSTQDTVVALEALTTYAEYIQAHVLDLTVDLKTSNERHLVTLTQSDRLKARRIPLKMSCGQIEVAVSGRGCALVQLTMTYNSKNLPKAQDFKLAVDVSSVSNVDECSVRKISPCVTYKGSSPLANMAVMEVSLPSGFIADRSSLDNLIQSGNYTKIKMFEETDRQINLYFTKLDKSEVCFSFSIMENTKLDYRKENLIKIYDYYNPERSILQFYKLANNCTEEHIQEIDEKGHHTSQLNKTENFLKANDTKNNIS